jgi:hypothetical protein
VRRVLRQAQDEVAVGGPIFSDPMLSSPALGLVPRVEAWLVANREAKRIADVQA